MAEQMKGITCCGDCGYYNWKKRKCNRCESIETDPRKHFYDDCPLPDVVEVVRCKDCRFAHMTYDGLCKQCDNATDDDDIKLTLYLPGDFYCAFGKRKEGDGE